MARPLDSHAEHIGCSRSKLGGAGFVDKRTAGPVFTGRARVIPRHLPPLLPDVLQNLSIGLRRILAVEDVEEIAIRVGIGMFFLELSVHELKYC